MKNQNEEDIKKVKISSEMLKNCKREIAKFGFQPKEYTQFLISVEAMKDEETVLQYNNNDIDKYRDKYLKSLEYSIGDQFQLDKFKIKSSSENGKQYETGYFAPRSFWDKVLETKLD